MRQSICCLLFGACLSPAFGADDATAKAALLKIETKMIAAMKVSDISYLKGLLTDDFKVTDEKKKTYNKSQWMDITTQTLQMVKIKNVTIQMVSIRTTGTTAVLHTKSSLDGTITIKGKTQALVDISSDEETWVKTANGWKFKKDITLSESATLDGKPFKAPA
jgi:hypothetical protein